MLGLSADGDYTAGVTATLSGTSVLRDEAVRLFHQSAILFSARSFALQSRSVSPLALFPGRG